jgi:hypothetical protein
MSLKRWQAPSPLTRKWAKRSDIPKKYLDKYEAFKRASDGLWRLRRK